jgi:hypothetical protein
MPFPPSKCCLPKLKMVFDEKVWRLQILTANSYAYALDCPDVGWGLPGHLNDNCLTWLYEPDEITPQGMAELLYKDGLKHISKEEALNAKDGHFIALWLSPGKDVLFLRRDSMGTWSYKPGDGPPKSLDSEDQMIQDPSQAELYGYGVFVGFYAVPAEGVNYVPKDEYIPEAA